MKSYEEILAIQKKHMEMLKKFNPELNEGSGIYIFTRFENGFKYAYVGQAKNILKRLAEHMMRYDQHIDKSLKKRKLFSQSNRNGWFITAYNFPLSILDDQEKAFIKMYHNMGFQLYNTTTGGQGEGKTSMDNQKEPRGYRDGLKQGYLNARRDVAKLFEKNLSVTHQGKLTKFKEKALEKFKNFIDL